MTHAPALRRTALIAAVLGAASGALGASRPNIVLILCDDMGYSDVGCYGGEIRTPNLDALAAGGLRFTQFYNAGRCCPTRASLLTGLYPHQAGVGHMVYRNNGPGYIGYLNDRCATVAEVLAAAGYRTLMAGKWHVGHRQGQWPTDRGFERFYGINIHVDSYFKVLPGCDVFFDGKLEVPATADPTNKLHPGREWYTTDVFTDYALTFLDEQADANKPFFLYLAYNAPHWPIEAPDEDIARYQGKYAAGWEALRRQKHKRMIEMGILPAGCKLSPPDAPPWGSLSEDKKKETAFRREIYAAQIDRMDQNIGRVVAKLKELGVLDETLILFLSDNGCSAEQGMFGYNDGRNTKANFAEWRKKSGRSASQGQAWANASNSPFRLYKKWVHEGGIATPLIAHWPEGIGRQLNGRLTHQPGHVIDLLATCADVGGAAYPETRAGRPVTPLEGKSLLPILQGRQRPGHEAIYWEHETHAAIRQGKWKLVSLDAARGPKWELYDLDTDRTELTDLAEKHPDRVDQMKAAWTAWARRANALPWPHERAKAKK